MLVEMRRVDIVIPRDDAGAALRAVHRAGLVHLVPFDAPSWIGPATFAAQGELAVETRYRQALEWVVSAAALLPATAGPQRGLAELWDLADDQLLERVEALAPIAEEAGRLASERIRLSAEVARLRGYREIVDGLRGVVGRLPTVRGYAATGVVISSRYRAILPTLRTELDKMTDGRCEVISGDLDRDRVAAILLYPTWLSGELARLLGGRDLEEVTLPRSLAGVPFDELGPRLAADEDALSSARAATEAALETLAHDYSDELRCLRLVLEDRVAEARALSEAGGSDHLVVVSGWVPAERLTELREALAAIVGPEVAVVERDDAEPRPADAPVAMTNASPIRAYEALASFVTVPRYGTLDPTPTLAITVPAFIGLMVGDAGYGLVLLVALILARRQLGDRPPMPTVWPIGLAIAVSTIVFGILFGEIFGLTGRAVLGIEPLWFDRRERIVDLLVLALIIGFAQITLGLVLGIVNGLLTRERREVVSRTAMLVSLMAVVLLIAVTVWGLPDELMTIGVSAVVLGVVLVVLTVGIAGPVELLGIFGNILSYARIMAIGLAGVMLALVADRLGSAMPSLVLGALVAGLFHVLNIGLGFFDASVQSLRLHYVEFFTKFVEPGGMPYRPFVSSLGAGFGATATAPGG
jgi:V/A-type H+-transporting ATPase subunit I